MKKLMIAASAALCATVGFSAVESQNIVGYNTATVTRPNKKTFALQFESPENPGQAIRIDNLFPGTTFKSAATWAGSDQIWAWDTTINNWSKYAYYGNPRATPAVPAGWYKYNFLTDNSFSAVTDADVIQPGQTFLYVRNVSGSITLQMAGQIKAMSDATQSVSVTRPNKVFMSYPWPVELKIAELSTKATHSNLKTAATWAGSDQIWAWDTTANNWAKYAYYANPRATPAVPAGWYKYNFLTDNSFSAVTDDDKIAAGEGFLYVRNVSGTNVITWNALTPAE